MSLNHSLLWPKIGKLIKVLNSYGSLATTTMPADLASIVSLYGTTNTGLSTSQIDIDGLNGAYGGFQDNVSSWSRSVAGYADSTISNYDLVISQLPSLSQQSTQPILAAIIQDMIDNSQSMDASSISLGAVSPFASNIGNGTILLDSTLDGYTAPIKNGQANVNYAGLASQMAPPSITHLFTCNADSYGDGRSEGGEGFSWFGGQLYQAFDYHTEGAGSGNALTVANGDSNVNVQNKGFTSFASSANVPDGWTLDSGTAGTNCVKETTAANIYRGAAACKLVGDGTTATIQLSQAISAGQFKPRRRYLLTVRVFRSGSVPGSGTFSIKFVSASGSYVAGVSEQINLAANALPTSYGLQYFYWTTPSFIPSDLKLTIAITGTLDSGTDITLSSMSFAALPYHAGINASVVAGATPFVKGDRFQALVTNTESGSLFQQFSRRHWLAQLPTSGSPTILNSLCQ